MPLVPCATTTVIGIVLLNDRPMTAVENAVVTLPSIGPLLTNGQGEFVIANVAAGPNGSRCLSNPFYIAGKDLNGAHLLTFDEIGGSAPSGTWRCDRLRCIQTRLLTVFCLYQAVAARKDPLLIARLAISSLRGK